MGKLISNASTKRTAVVTGANKGIGFEVCRQLASHGITVILTARDEGKGTEAVEKLKNSGVSDVLFHQLDVADPSSVSSLANFIKTEFGRIDILVIKDEEILCDTPTLLLRGLVCRNVNNAGIGGLLTDDQTLNSFLKDQTVTSFLKEQENGYDRLMEFWVEAQESYEKVVGCLNINYYGMKRVTEALIPLLQLSQLPTVVNVSSRLGRLNVIPSESIREALGVVDEKTEVRLDEVIQSYLYDLKEGKLKENGWPTCSATYKLSKVAVTTYTRMLAMKYPSMRINCVSPGVVKTDMNYDIGTLTAEEGAKGPVMLALLPDGSPSGLFYDQTEVSSFE
ncbi:(+)-neomenthol dehydrogenase-like isoform X1 [Asparagus officinalis]|uniref:(+)-neomenthol dehydrogenase-like isoform X1 n=1 Tax=Asparagus officinalis TaxID=4686 RepID=UPI00098E3033|nr:(+)-neomenthol dehydrogenase-like isoform X1 [Asparagus officinalis]